MIEENLSDELCEYGHFFQDLYCRYQIEFGLLGVNLFNLSDPVRIRILKEITLNKRQSDILVLDGNLLWLILPQTVGDNLKKLSNRLQLWTQQILCSTEVNGSRLGRFFINDSIRSYGNFYSMIEEIIHEVSSIKSS